MLTTRLFLKGGDSAPVTPRPFGCCRFLLLTSTENENRVGLRKHGEACLGRQRGHSLVIRVRGAVQVSVSQPASCWSTRGREALECADTDCSLHRPDRARRRCSPRAATKASEASQASCRSGRSRGLRTAGESGRGFCSLVSVRLPCSTPRWRSPGQSTPPCRKWPPC